MTLGRVADQAVGQELQMVLSPSASWAAASYHVSRKGAAQEGMFTLFAGALPASDGILTSSGKFLDLVLDITNVGGAGTVTVTIRGYDPVSGKVYLILASTALAAVATTVLRVGPGLTAAGNLTANDFIPISWGVDVVVGVNAVIFSLGALFMP